MCCGRNTVSKIGRYEGRKIGLLPFAKQTDNVTLNSFQGLKHEMLKQVQHDKAAFTLAEVLITLGIIGVVAALTMPNLIVNYQKQQTVTQLKKAYSTVLQALKLSEIDNGSMEDWNYQLSAKDFYNKYLKNYIKSYQEVPQSEIKKRIIYRYVNGDRLTTNAKGTLGNDNSFTAKINNGVFISIDGFYSNNKARGIIFDLNGFAKPNQYSKDVFAFTVVPGGLATGYSEPDKEDREQMWHSCYQSGYACGNKIIHDGWKIADDYPW